MEEQAEDKEANRNQTGKTSARSGCWTTVLHDEPNTEAEEEDENEERT